MSTLGQVANFRQQTPHKNIKKMKKLKDNMHQIFNYQIKFALFVSANVKIQIKFGSGCSVSIARKCYTNKKMKIEKQQNVMH